MISSASSSSTSSLSVPPSSENNPPSDGEEFGSFTDVMQQHEGSSQSNGADAIPTPPSNSNAKTQASNSVPSNSISDDSAATDANAPVAPPSTAPAPAPAKTIPAPLAAGSDLSAMIVQASVLASNAQQILAAKGIVNSAGTTSFNSTGTTSAKNTAPSATDLATLIAQATLLLSGTRSTTSAKTSTPASTSSTADANKDSNSGSASTKDPSPSNPASVDLSTLIAQSSILLSTNQSSVAGSVSISGKDLPPAGSGKGLNGLNSKEKKSTSSNAEGSFLQSGAPGSSTALNFLGLAGALSNITSNSSVNQALTTTTGAKTSTLGDLASGASSLAGTANVERGKGMNSDLNSSEVELLSGAGANQLSTPAPADLHIQLSSNNDFTDALKQVMHVAQLSQTSESRTPMRVEMEIQTPPGAIVNIYVSKSGDQLRAQLSTNDPQALAWVQDQMSSLRSSSNLGVEVKWLPPQMETGTPITTSGGQDANLSWNQGGGQSNYQQPDERQQSGRQNESDETAELAAAGSSPFMNTLTALGRAA
jgi:hypothetical protein